MRDTFHKFHDIEQEAQKSTEVVNLYILDYYNVRECSRDNPAEEYASTRILNALTENLNSTDARLPKYLIVIID